MEELLIAGAVLVALYLFTQSSNQTQVPTTAPPLGVPTAPPIPSAITLGGGYQVPSFLAQLAVPGAISPSSEPHTVNYPVPQPPPSAVVGGGAGGVGTGGLPMGGVLTPGVSTGTGTSAPPSAMVVSSAMLAARPDYTYQLNGRYVTAAQIAARSGAYLVSGNTISLVS